MLRRASPGARADRGGVGRSVAVGAVDPVARRVEVHETGIQREQRLVVVTQAINDAGAERLEHRVGSAHELVDDLAAFVARQVDGDALLALQHLDPAGFRERHDRAHRVAVELLDLDDARAVVGEDRRAERGGVERSQLDDRHTRERRLHGCLGTTLRLLLPCATTEFRAVFVQRRRRTLDGGGSRVHPHERTRLCDRSERGVGDRDDLVVVDALRMMEELGAMAEDLGEHIGVVVERLVPLVDGLRPHRVDHRLPELLTEVDVVGARCVLPLRIGEHPLEPERAHERDPQPFRRL